jgi:hypothetical protein
MYAFVAVIVMACGVNRSHEKALSEWRRNEKIVDVAIKGGQFDPDRYLQAAIFFHEVTGLIIRGNAGTLGFLPDRYSAQDFAQVKKWCKKNCQNLYWDEKTHSVKVPRSTADK